MAQNETTMTLQGDCDILIERYFAAPPKLVFRAWTDPELAKLWWAPKELGAILVTCEADVRVGGRYHYVLKNPDGELIGFAGSYREIAAPDRLAYTQVLEGMEEMGEALVQVTFTGLGDRTCVKSLETYPSAEVRHMAVASGMEEGLRLTMDQLDALLASMVS